MQAGTYRLYTREYYRQGLARLTPNGMMTQWIPTYQMPAAAAELAIRTFLDVFDHALIFTGGEREFILLGSPAPIDLRTVEKRFYEQPTVTADLRRMGVTSPLSLIARIVHGDAALRRRFGAGRVIGDAHNDLEFLFRTPDQREVITYAPFEILTDIDAETLACGNDLRDVLTHFGRLRYHVPGFPVATLLTVRQTASAGVRLADVDWEQVTAKLTLFSTLRNAGDLRGATGPLREAIELAPEQPLPLLRLASVQLRLGQLRAAEETLRRFQRIEPDQEIGHRLLGTALTSQGRDDEALTAFGRAVEVDPDSPEAHRALGNALVRRGRREEGMEHLRQALALDPANKDLQRSLNIASDTP